MTHYWNFQKFLIYLHSIIIASFRRCFAAPSLIRVVYLQFSIPFAISERLVETPSMDSIVYLINHLISNSHFIILLFIVFNEMFEFLFSNFASFDCCLLQLALTKSKKLHQFINFLFLVLALHFQDLCHLKFITVLRFFHRPSLTSLACFSTVQPIRYEGDIFFLDTLVNVSNAKNLHQHHFHLH